MSLLTRLFLLVIPSLIAVIVLACSDGEDDPTPTPTGSGTAAPTPAPPTGGATIPEHTITSTDFAYELDGPIESGLVTLRLTNTGAEPHQAGLFRINEGISDEELQAAIEAGDPAEIIPLLTPEGGPNTIIPGQEQKVTKELESGRYVMLCFVLSPDGVPHIAKGMSHQFEVTPATAPADPPAPEAENKLTLADFAFLNAEALHSGETTIEVDNAGPQPHELTIMRLEDDVTIDQVTAAISAGTPPPPGPSPIIDAGGVAGIKNGDTAWVKLNLTPGNYALLCFYPDPATSKYHFELGMQQSIQVE